MKKIFISHSHSDTFYAQTLIDFLEKIGVSSNDIFCSSIEGYGVPLGNNFLEEIKSWLNDNVIVIFLLSQNYYSSPTSLCEMGASWITAKKVFPILIPPLTYDDFKGVFQHHIGFLINEKYKLNEFKEEIEKELQIKNKLKTSIWEKFKDDKIKLLNNKIDSLKNQIEIKNENFPEQLDLDDKLDVKKSNSLNIEVVNIPKGYYSKDNNVIPITEFQISKYLITQNLYERIMKSNPSHFRGNLLPVENVNWFGAIEFCNKLSEECNLEKVYLFEKGRLCVINEHANGYRLPFAEEWEYACLGGKDNYPSLNENLEEIAWFSKNAKAESHSVGNKKENGYQLYDMLGNVYEWCYSKMRDRKNIEIEEKKIIKGGSWAEFKNNLSVHYQQLQLPNIGKNTIGFRIVKSL